MIEDLRKAYEALLSADNSNVRSDGMMLFMAFDGLFTHVTDQYKAAMSGLSEFSIPKTWRKVDMIGEAGALQVGVFNCPHTSRCLSSRSFKCVFSLHFIIFSKHSLMRRLSLYWRTYSLLES